MGQWCRRLAIYLRDERCQIRNKRGEIQASYLGKNIDINADFSFVRGLDKTNNTNLSFMPADKFQLTLSTKESRDLTTSIRFTKGFEQSRLANLRP